MKKFRNLKFQYYLEYDNFHEIYQQKNKLCTLGSSRVRFFPVMWLAISKIQVMNKNSIINDLDELNKDKQKSKRLKQTFFFFYLLKMLNIVIVYGCTLFVENIIMIIVYFFIYTQHIQ
jgi:hypothetical protein